MFDFYCDVLLAVPVELVSSLPDFPTIPSFTSDNSIVTYLNTGVQFLSFVLPLNVILPVVAFSEAVLHYKAMFALIDRIKHWVPFWGG